MIVQLEAIIHNLKRIGENNWVSLRKSICSFQRHSAKIAEKNTLWTQIEHRFTVDQLVDESYAESLVHCKMPIYDLL